MRDTPKNYGNDSNHANEPLYTREFIFHRPYGYDSSSLSRLKRDEKKDPDEEDGDDADGESYEEPDAPAGLRTHVLESDDILRRGDR